MAASWQAMGGIVAAFAAPPDPAEADRPPRTTRRPPEVLAARAVEHGDEHVIKLTEAAEREFRRTGERTLLVAADRFRRRIEPS